uniref:Putative secreted protein n=1 Tax=Amblyomma parvum TaxID=251391 RepID=A0A023FZY7_AMBPA
MLVEILHFWFCNCSVWFVVISTFPYDVDGVSDPLVLSLLYVDFTEEGSQHTTHRSNHALGMVDVERRLRLDHYSAHLADVRALQN